MSWKDIRVPKPDLPQIGRDFSVTLQDELGARWTITVTATDEDDAGDKASIQAWFKDKARTWDVVMIEEV